MRLFILLLCLMCTVPAFSQDDYDKSLSELEKVNNLLLDASASFLKFPSSHSNTMIVFNQLKKLNTIYKGIQSNKYEVLSKWDNYKVRQFYNTTDKMQAITDAFEELLRTIAGYNSAGIEGPVMEILLEPLFDEAGWEKRTLNITCTDAYFVEYSYGGFKMMFIKSTLPANDYRNQSYHNIEVTFTYEGQYGGGGSYYVGGNKNELIPSVFLKKFGFIIKFYAIPVLGRNSVYGLFFSAYNIYFTKIRICIQNDFYPAST